MSNEVTFVFRDSAQLREIVSDMAYRIRDHYRGQSIVAVPVLNGAFMFAADLLRHLEPLQVEVLFAQVNTYKNNERSEGVPVVEIYGELPEARHVLVIDDIVDTGYTSRALREAFGEANDVRVASLFLRDSAAAAEDWPDFVGSYAPEHLWLFGYGMDDRGGARHWPVVWAREAPEPPRR